MLLIPFCPHTMDNSKCDHFCPDSHIQKICQHLKFGEYCSWVVLKDFTKRLVEGVMDYDRP